MAKLTPNFQFLPPADRSVLSRFARMLLQLWQGLAFVINGQIGFGDGTNSDNINGVWASVPNTGPANSNFTITHNLGRVPVGYILMTSAQGTEIYTGSVAATTTQITLRSAQANDSITLFIV